MAHKTLGFPRGGEGGERRELQKRAARGPQNAERRGAARRVTFVRSLALRFAILRLMSGLIESDCTARECAKPEGVTRVPLRRYTRATQSSLSVFR